MLEKHILVTADGSKTIHLPEWNESYHSKHGAIDEAYHVFIRNGFDMFENQEELRILEIGFGTGLNALITSLEAEKNQQKVYYTTIEAYPLEEAMYIELEYYKQLSVPKDCFVKIHEVNWEVQHAVNPYFTIRKIESWFEEIDFEADFDIVYFDAFGYRVQPHLWSREMFDKMYKALKIGGLLTTYACRKPIIDNMKAAGFEVKKLKGAVGKREMLLARKAKVYDQN